MNIFAKLPYIPSYIIVRLLDRMIYAVIALCCVFAALSSGWMIVAWAVVGFILISAYLFIGDLASQIGETI